VRRGSRRGVAVVAYLLALGEPRRDLALPEALAIGGAHRDHPEAKILHLARLLDIAPVAAVRGDDHPVSDDDRTRRARTGKLLLPRDVLIRAEAGGYAFLRRCALTSRATELLPIRSRDG